MIKWITLLFLFLGQSLASVPENCPLKDGQVITGVKLNGLKKTKTKVVQRELYHTTQKQFVCQEHLAEIKRLQGLDLFAKLQTSANEDTLVFEFVEYPGWMPLPSVKISDQDGYLLGPALIFLNLGGSDVRGEAHYRLTTYPKFARAQEFTFALSSPWLLGLPIEYETSLVHADSWNALKEYQENSWVGKLDLIYRPLKNWGLYLGGDAAWVRADDKNLAFARADAWNYWGGGGAGIIYDQRERRMNPHKGLRWENSYKGFAGDYIHQLLLSDLRFWVPIPWGKESQHFLHGNGLLRKRWGHIPLYEFYHPGGANSLRGLKADPTLGFQNELITSLEYRWEQFPMTSFEFLGFPLSWGLQWVLGYEQAWAWDKSWDSKGALKHGALTLGAHVLLPGFDRLRVEFAQPTNGEDWKITVAFYEKFITQRWRAR